MARSRSTSAVVRAERGTGAEIPQPIYAADLRTLADPVIAGYLGNYASRVRDTAGKKVFKAEVQNAMLALVYQWLGVRHSVAARANDLEAIDAVTRAVFKRQSTHSVAIDVCGHAWAASYGTLPYLEPPVPQLEWVFVSGSTPGAISGVLSSAWRALYLASAWPLLSYRHRRSATAELDRRVAYLIERGRGLIDSTDGPTRPHQAAQCAFILFELAAWLDDGDVLAVGSDLASSLLPLQRENGSIPVSPGDDTTAMTGQIAQFALAAAGSGELAARDRAVAFMLEKRRSTEQKVLVRDDNSSVLELSPWVALALLSLDRTNSRLTARQPRDTSR